MGRRLKKMITIQRVKIMGTLHSTVSLTSTTIAKVTSLTMEITIKKMRVVVEAQLERPCYQSCLEDWASPRHLTSSLLGRTDSQNTVQTPSCRRELGVDECQTIPCFLPIGAIESALRSSQATTASCCIGDLISSIMTMTQLLTFQTVMYKHSDWTAPE